MVNLYAAVLTAAAAAAAAAAAPPIVIAGGTGRVGAAVVRSLIARRGDDNIVVLARDLEKARVVHGSGIRCLLADYADEDSLRAALSEVAPGFRLFVACNNGPAQASLESAVCRAAHEAGCAYAVKLSTATAVLELKEGGPYAAHLEVEALLRELALPHAVLRPNLFIDEVGVGGFLGVSGPLGCSDDCTHPFAAAPISVVDVRDVAMCAAALLDADEPDPAVGVKYEITGPAAIRLGDELASAISSVRPRPVTIGACTVDEYIAARQLPPPIAANLAGFFHVLATQCAATTDVVQSLTGAPPRDVRQFVHHHARDFLPERFERLLGAPARSFREAARVRTLPVADELAALAPDELLIRVLVAGVNGGADTFSVTRAAEHDDDASTAEEDDDASIPLGKEGVGVTVAVGDEAAAAGFAPGQRVAFIGVGFTQYTRVRMRLALVVDGEADAAEQTALRVSGHTAAVALGYTSPVRAGDVVVVTACCGATGSFAAQLAKAAGATVIGTVGSAAKAQVARDLLGIDRVVQYHDEDLATVLKAEYPDGVDLAYEGVGGPLLGGICANLKPDGRVLVVGSISQYPHNLEKAPHGVEGLGDIMDDVFRPGKTVDLPSGGQLIGNVWGDSFSTGVLPAYRDRIYADHAAGKLVSLVDTSQTFRGLAQAPDAVEHMLAGRNTGKVVLYVSDT